MEFKKSVEKNPLTYIATCVIAAATLTAGVMQHFSSQELVLLKERNQSNIDDLNSKLASFRRGIPGSEFFDIRTLLYSRSSPDGGATPPSAMSTFFPENFYAAKAQPDWVYKKTTELDVLSDLIGPPPAGISQNLHQAITLLPLHLWKSKAELQVQGGDLFRKVYPFVSVEKVTTQQLRTLVGIAAKDRDDEADNDASAAARDVQKAISTKNVNAQEFIDNMDKAFRNDIIGAFFSAQLQAQFSAAILFPKTTVTLVEVQKVGNVLYAQFLITLKDVKVGGHPYAEYYVRKELIVVSTPESAFVVGTLLPSPEPAPRDPSFAAVSKWLNDFRVVI